MSPDPRVEMKGRGKETFIMVSDLMDVEYCTYAADLLSFNIKDKLPTFNRYAEEVMESRNLSDSTEGLDKMINADRRLADHLKSDVAERLVKILKESDDVFIQSSSAYILSRAKFDICGTIIREKATPVLVKLMSSKCYIIAIPVVVTLTRLACVSPDYVSIIVREGALKFALQIAKTTNRGSEMTDHLAKFMAVVCRGNLPQEKEWLALTILEELLKRRMGTYCHIARACYALSYLSYGRPVKIKQETCERLIRFIAHSDNTVVCSALGVVGNIVRWGNSDQIEILAKDPEFLRCLGTILSLCKPKKFQKEACQIISTIAAKSQTITQDMHKEGLIKLLEKLLQVEESDVMREAECTILMTNKHGCKQIDEYEDDVKREAEYAI